MALTDFFRINLPYGMMKNSNDEWFVFNREYVPLGWNSKKSSKSIYDENHLIDYPVYTKYKGLTDERIMKIIPDPEHITWDKEGKIHRVFFYDDRTNPQSNEKYWDVYFKIIKSLSKYST